VASVEGKKVKLEQNRCSEVREHLVEVEEERRDSIEEERCFAMKKEWESSKAEAEFAEGDGASNLTLLR